MARAASDLEFAEQPVVAARTRSCPVCSRSVDVRSRHVVVHGSSIEIYCSSECLRGESRAADLIETNVANEVGTPGRLRPLAAGGALLGMLFLSDTRLPEPEPAPPPAAPGFVLPTIPRPPPVPKEDPATALEQAWVDEILRDVWIHPLGGPKRRMPMRDSRVFGAERPGERPPECRNGHCGVDIGGEIWGEPVLATHDGVVDRVQRGPNDDHGGLYVRLSHRNGTVFTQYFHLAAIPRWIVVGKKVEAGDVIGLVGDTGVRNSGPHLHFTISVKPSPELPEQFIDPEPLIALWPLKTPSGPSTDSAPGLVRGASPRRKRAARPRPEPVTAAPAPDGAAAGALPTDVPAAP